ncbi:amidase [Nocardia suismassiliense]|uniref:amidase n=1 Tax=Nocardia suismassiliense TaxID=2077092 RepID=UPI000D1F531B|nr:amidase [Nocardia suismassiliense]
MERRKFVQAVSVSSAAVVAAGCSRDDSATTSPVSASAFSYPEQPPATDPTNTDALAPFPVQQAPRPVAKPRSYELSLPDHRGIDASDPTGLGVLELAALLRAGALTSERLTRALLDRAEDKDKEINSFVRRYPDTALAAAKEADARRRSEGDRAALLCGIPLALKDVFAVRGRPLTAGLPALLGDNVAAGDCTAWARLKADGMPLLGHVQTHQMAIGSLTEQTANPWNFHKVPGGSSGGSAAALAARFTPAALGTDTAGSLRIPASACNVCSIKPTAGLVSVYGTIPVAWSFDNVGPMARSAADLGPLLAAIAGFDPFDPRTNGAIDWPQSYPSAPRASGLVGTRLGIPATAPTLDPGVADSYRAMQATLRSLGAEVIEVEAPAPMNYLDMIIGQGVEIGAYQAQWWPARRDAYTRYLTESFAFLLAHEPKAIAYNQLLRERTRRQQDWCALLRDHALDAILLPVLGTELVDRPPFGDYGPQEGMAMSPQTNDANYCGLPAVAIPAQPSTVTGLPVGVQLMGAPYSDAHMLQIAVDIQAHTDYHTARPHI